MKRISGRLQQRTTRLLFAIPALALMLTAVQTVVAQPGGGRAMGSRVAGTVISEEDNEGIAGATVAIWNAADSSLVTGTVTNVDGLFSIEGLRPGTFYVEVSSLGHEKKVISPVEIKGMGQSVDLGTVTLVISLDATEVTITADRNDVEFHSDRTVYNVENQAVTAGGNAIDVLKNVPQIEVDIDDNVSLRGSQNVAVHINNRPVPISGSALAAFLKSLPADMVESIEVIPNPSAKYDPDGMAGIINIVLKEKKQESGVSGTVSASGSTTNSYNATGSINARAGKLNTFSSYSFRYDERKSEGGAFRENRLVDPVSILEEESNGKWIGRSHVLNTSLDYALSETSSLTATALLSGRNSDGNSKIDYLVYDLGGSDTTMTERLTPSDGTSFDMDYTLGYRWIKEPSRHEFTVEGRFFSEKNLDDGSYLERLAGELSTNDSVVQRQLTEYDNRNHGGTFRADYVRPLGEKGRLETGYKGDITRINNSVYSESFDAQAGEFAPDTDLNNEFVYDEQIHAAYAIYGHTFGAFDAQAGLRAEQALTNFELLTTNEDFENNYFSLFPSASLSYAISPTSQVRASYSRRINRPGVWRLNPFPQYEDRLNLRRGNPYLEPEYIDAIELGFNQFMPWGTISVSPYYRHSTNLIERWLTIDSQGVSTVSWENFESTDSYGAELVGTFRVKDRLRGFLNFSAYQFDVDGSNLESDLTNNAFGWSASGNASLTVLPWLELQANYFYRAPIKISRGRIEAFQSADAALKGTFLNKRASLTLRVSDIFNTMEFRLFREDPTYLVNVLHGWQSQQATLSFSYNFGQQDQTRRPQRRRDDGGEQGGGTPAGVGF